MKILLTGGSGDLGHTLCPLLRAANYNPIVFDIRSPRAEKTQFVEGSIMDRRSLRKAFAKANAVVHIAAWHGIHEFRKQRDAYDFWDLNVTGTFNVFQAAVDAGIKNVMFISSTSVDEPGTNYGQSKILGESLAHSYAMRHSMNIPILRPRAFIPHWNRDAYSCYLEWCRWYWSGAVHIDDVAQAVMKTLALMTGVAGLGAPAFTIDGAYEYSDEDLAKWDEHGPGSTFKHYYPEFVDLARQHGLRMEHKPKKLDISATKQAIDYQPVFSLRSLLIELEKYGEQGPPSP